MDTVAFQSYLVLDNLPIKIKLKLDNILRIKHLGLHQSRHRLTFIFNQIIIDIKGCRPWVCYGDGLV